MSVPIAIGLGMMGSVVVMGAIASAQAASLTNWQFDPTANELQLTVKEGTTPRYFLMAQPARIVVDLPGTSVGEVNAHGTYAGSVRQIRVSQFQPGVTRIVMELSPDISLAPGQVKLQKVDGSRWTLRPLIVQSPASPKPSSRTEPAPPPTPVASGAPVIANRIEPAPPAALTATLPPTPTTTHNITLPVPSVTMPTVAPLVQPSLPPNAATPDSPNDGVMVDTAGAVAIAVPPPDMTPLPLPVTVAPPSAPMAAGVVPPVSKPVALPRVLSTMPLVPKTSLPAAPMIAAPPAVDLPDLPTTVAAAPDSKSPQVTVPPIGQTTLSSSADTTPLPPAAPVMPFVPPHQGVAIAAPDQLPSTLNTGPDTTPTIQVPPLAPIAPVSPVAPVPMDATSVVVPTTSSAATLLPLKPSAFPVPPQPARQPTPPSLPPMVSVPPTQPSVNVPSLQPQITPPASVAPLPSNPTIPAPVPTLPVEPRVVDFGQPLPAVPVTPMASKPLPGFPGNSNLAYRPLPSNILLPIGTPLDLRYPGQVPLSLPSSTSVQEVLLLQTDIRDGLGNIIAPQDSRVIGRFETGTSGSRFVAQAISLGSQTIPLVAESESFDGSRKVSDNSLVRNTGLGLLAGGLIGGLAGSAGWGVVSGAAAGAAATWLTAPKPATIQPGQIIQVRLTEDLQRP